MTSEKWIVVIAILASLCGLLFWGYSGFLGFSRISVISILAVFAGLLCAFTNANDRRVLSVRKKVVYKGQSHLECDEASGFLEPKDLLAWGGFFGSVLTWISLPLIYQMFSATFGRPYSNISGDIAYAASISFCGIPAFLVLGALTIISTLAYLYVTRASLIYLVFPTIVTTISTLLIGFFYFGDPLFGSDLAIPLLIMALVLFVFSKKAALDKERVTKVNYIGLSFLGLIVVVTEIARSFLIRSSLGAVPDSSRFFVALCFRALYFSPFLAYTFWHFIARQRSREAVLVTRSNRHTLKRAGVVLTTSITFVAAYSLSTPSFAYNLSSSTLLVTVAQILAYPIVGAWYFTGSSMPEFWQRFVEMFGKSAHDKSSRVRFMVFYLICLSLFAIWVVYQLVG